MKISRKKPIKNTVKFGDIAAGEVFYLSGTENEDGSVDNECLYMKVWTSPTATPHKFTAVILESGEIDNTVIGTDEVVLVKAHLKVEV